MPLIEADLIKALVARHRTTLKAVIVPYAQGRRGNPVLFDGITFEALLRVKGDQGGRAIFDRFPPSQLAWDDSVLFDVDTPEDLRRLRDME
jgi:molybdenum cofactor cytidylyltransferase